MKTTSVLTLIFITLFTLLPHANAADTTKWGLPDGAKARFGKGTLSEVAISPDGTRLAAGSSTGIWIYDAETGEELSLLTNGMLRGRNSIITSVVFSQDGEMLASGSAEGSVRVWDMKTSLIFRTFRRHSSSVNSVAFSRSGEMLASGGADGGIHLYDVETGTVRSSGHGQLSAVNSVAFSPDAKTLASGGNDGTIRLWNLQKDALEGTRIIYRPNQFQNSVYSISFSTDGNVLASGSVLGIDLWDARTGGHQHTFTGDRGPVLHVNGVSFSPDSKTLVTISYASSGLLLWDVETRTLRHRLYRGSVSIGSSLGHNLAFSSDGETLVSSGNSGIQLFDLETNSLRYSVTEGYQTIDRVAYSPDGKTIATGSDEGIHLWNVETGVSKKLVSTRAYSVAYSPDGRTIAVGSRGSISLYDVETGALRHTLRENTALSRIFNVAFSPDSKTLVSADGENKTVRVWDVETGTIRRTFTEHTGWVMDVAFHRDGKTIASSGGKTILLWDVETSAILHSLTFRSHIEQVTFSPDGKILAGGGSIYNMETSEFIGEGSGGSPAAFSRDGKILATASGSQYHRNERIKLWNVGDFSLLREFTYVVSDMAFSRDGNTLASVGPNNVVMLWDITPEPIVESTYFTQTYTLTDQGYFMDIALSPDGKTVAGVSSRSMELDRRRINYASTICLWDLRTNTFRHRTKIFHARGLGGNTFHCVEFSPDGNTLAYSDGGVIRLWDVVFGTPLHTLPVSDQGREGVRNDSGIHMEFSPDGNTLVYSDSRCRYIFLWDVKTGTLRHTLTEPTNSVQAIKFSPDGNTLASYDADDTIHLWNMRTGGIHPPLLWSRKMPDISFYQGGFIHSFSPDGRMLVTVTSSTAGISHLWDVETGTLKKTFNTRIYAFSPDRRTFVGFNRGFWVLGLHNAETGVFIREVPARQFLNENLLISVNGIWDVNTSALKQLFGFAHGEAAFGYPGLRWNRSEVYHQEAQTAAIVHGEAHNEIHIYKFTPESDTPIMDTHGDSIVRIDAGLLRLPAIEKVTSFDILASGTNYRPNLAFSSDGSTLVSIENVMDRYRIKESRILLWDMATRGSLRTITVPEHFGVLGLNFGLSPDGKMLAVTKVPSSEEIRKRDNSTFYLWNIETGIRRYTFTANAYAGANVFAFSPDGKILASGGWGIVELWNVETRSLRHTFNLQDQAHIIKVMFTPDGKTLVAQNKRTTRLWDVRTGTLKQTYPSEHPTKYAALHPKGKTLISGDEQTFVIRHMQSRIPFAEYRHRLYKTQGAAFSPDGKTIAFFGPEINLWNAETGVPDIVPNKILSDPKSDIVTVVFSPDGSTLVGCDRSGAIYSWDLRLFNGAGGINIQNPAPVPVANAPNRKVHVIWYYPKDEDLRGDIPVFWTDDGIVRVTDYITSNNVRVHLEDVAEFFRNQLGATFEFDSNAEGDINIRLIKSDKFFNDASKKNNSGIDGSFLDTDSDFYDRLWEDIKSEWYSIEADPFDPSQHIYLALVQSQYNGYHRGRADIAGGRAMVRLGSSIKRWSDESVKTCIAHELGHVFGLGHDFSEQVIMSYDFEKSGGLFGNLAELDGEQFSERSKNWLSVHPDFSNYQFGDISVDNPMAIKVSTHPFSLTNSGVSPGGVIPLTSNISTGTYEIYVQVHDPDGLHQVEFITPMLKDTCCGPDYDSTGKNLNYALAKYINANTSDRNAEFYFDTGAKSAVGVIDITKWVEECYDRQEKSLSLFFTAIDSQGNITKADKPFVINNILFFDKPLDISSDVNGDGDVNIQDLVTVALAIGEVGENDADVNGDGEVNIQDIVIVAAAIGDNAAAPTVLRQPGAAHITKEEVQHWLTLAQQSNLTDATSVRGIRFLEQLLAAMTPKETTLFPWQTIQIHLTQKLGYRISWRNLLMSAS